MKRLALPITCVCILISFSSCKKLIDKLFSGRDGGHQHNEKCRIAKTWSDEANFTFFYNANGDPDSVISAPGADQPFFLDFKYDASNRLVEYNSYFRQRYSITHNSVYTYPTDSTVYEYTKDLTSPYQETSHLYTFDSQGRIIHETTRLEFSGPGDEPYTEEIDFVYNAEGNRISPDEFGMPFNYDDKKSIYRTSRIWQFLGQNYSRNNSQPAISYNSIGLPLEFVDQYYFILNRNTGFSRIPVKQIEYNCTGSED